MKNIIIKIYISEPAQNSDDRKLVRSILVENKSDKLLTAKRASKIIERELPEYKVANAVLVIKTNEGWQARRTIESSKKCTYHYRWEYAVVCETSEF